MTQYTARREGQKKGGLGHPSFVAASRALRADADDRWIAAARARSNGNATCHSCGSTGCSCSGTNTDTASNSARTHSDRSSGADSATDSANAANTHTRCRPGCRRNDVPASGRGRISKLRQFDILLGHALAEFHHDTSTHLRTDRLRGLLAQRRTRRGYGSKNGNRHDAENRKRNRYFTKTFHNRSPESGSTPHRHCPVDITSAKAWHGHVMILPPLCAPPCGDNPGLYRGAAGHPPCLAGPGSPRCDEKHRPAQSQKKGWPEPPSVSCLVDRLTGCCRRPSSPPQRHQLQLQRLPLRQRHQCRLQHQPQLRRRLPHQQHRPLQRRRQHLLQRPHRLHLR